MDRVTVQELLDGVFEAEGLLLGGVAAVHSLEDEAVARIVRGLEHIRGQAMRQLEEAARRQCAGTRAGAVIRPHPAIERFLRTIRKEAQCAKAR